MRGVARGVPAMLSDDWELSGDPVALVVPVVLVGLLVTLYRLVQLPVERSDEYASVSVSIAPVGLTLLQANLMLFIASLSAAEAFWGAVLVSL